MTTRTRLSATVDDDLLEAGRQAVAAGHADSVSAWVNLALQRQVDHDRRMTAADEFISEYEAEHGEVTADDIAVAEGLDAYPDEGRAPDRSHRIVTFILDAGALVAIERGDAHLVALLKRERLAGRSPVSHGGVVGQVWRSGSGRQARLSRALRALDVRSLDEALGRSAGRLLGRDGSSDVIDAALVVLATHDDVILTSDPEDIERLAGTIGISIDVVHV